MRRAALLLILLPAFAFAADPPRYEQRREHDPKLAEGQIDTGLMVDVYHEYSHPYEMMEGIVKSLKPGGRVAFVEFRLEDDKVPIKLVHKMTEKQVLREMEPFPLKHVKTHAE